MFFFLNVGRFRQTWCMQDVNLPSVTRLDGRPLEVPTAAAESTPEAPPSGDSLSLSGLAEQMPLLPCV